VSGSNCACGAPLPLDQIRAGGISLIGQSSPVLTDDSPLVIDLKQPSAFVGKHWIVEHVCFTALLKVRAPVNGTPVNGLFLCPPGTPDGENLALASTGIGINLAARPITLPVTERAIPVEQIGLGQWVVNITLVPGFKMTIPGSWWLRAILNCQPGQPAPGPGTGSYGVLQATAAQEANTK
jgi:hypothetical protein